MELLARSKCGSALVAIAILTFSWVTSPQSVSRLHPDTASSAALAQCSAPRRTHGLQHIVGSIVHIDGGALLFVDVCVDQLGPFPFLMDSGSDISLVSSSLAARLGLAAAGPPRFDQGVGCGETVIPRDITNWSAGDVPLVSQRVLTGKLGYLSGHPIDGIIGSDILSRFGFIRLNYESGAISLEKPEDLKPRVGVVQGKLPLSRNPDVAIRVPLEVFASDRAVIVTVAVTVGPAVASEFLVDTGSVVSGISAILVRHAKLRQSRTRVVLQGSFACKIEVASLPIGNWRIGSTPLPATHIVELPPNESDIAGLLGSDVLGHYGVAVIDYSAGYLTLQRPGK